MNELKLEDYEYKITLWDKITQPFYSLKYTIRDHFENRRMKRQRYKYGYSNIDLYNIDGWFQTTFIEMLDKFEKTLRGYPEAEFEELKTIEYEWIIKAYNEIFEELKEDKNFEIKTIRDLINSNYTLDDKFIQWKLIIKRIIYCLRETDEEYSSFNADEEFKKYQDLLNYTQNMESDGYKIGPKTKESLIHIKSDWLDKAEEVERYRTKMKDEAFKLLGHYFFALWD